MVGASILCFWAFLREIGVLQAYLVVEKCRNGSLIIMNGYGKRSLIIMILHTCFVYLGGEFGWARYIMKESSPWNLCWVGGFCCFCLLVVCAGSVTGFLLVVMVIPVFVEDFGLSSGVSP